MELHEREIADEFCLKMPDFRVTFRDLLYAVNYTTWDRRLYFPSEGRRAEDFFAPKNSTASVGFEPANLGIKPSTLPLDHGSLYDTLLIP